MSPSESSHAGAKKGAVIGTESRKPVGFRGRREHRVHLARTRKGRMIQSGRPREVLVGKLRERGGIAL